MDLADEGRLTGVFEDSFAVIRKIKKIRISWMSDALAVLRGR